MVTSFRYKSITSTTVTLEWRPPKKKGVSKYKVFMKSSINVSLDAILNISFLKKNISPEEEQAY